MERHSELIFFSSIIDAIRFTPGSNATNLYLLSRYLSHSSFVNSFNFINSLSSSFSLGILSPYSLSLYFLSINNKLQLKPSVII